MPQKLAYSNSLEIMGNTALTSLKGSFPVLNVLGNAYTVTISGNTLLKSLEGLDVRLSSRFRCRVLLHAAFGHDDCLHAQTAEQETEHNAAACLGRA